MDTVGRLLGTQEAKVALGYRLNPDLKHNLGSKANPNPKP